MKLKPEVPVKGLEVWAYEWEDAIYRSDEVQPGDIIHRPFNFVTVGILIKDDETGISTATDLAEDGGFRGVQFVPAKMIVWKWKVGDLKSRGGRRTASKPIVLDQQSQSTSSKQSS